MTDPDGNAPARHLVEGAMIDLGKVDCWMPMPGMLPTPMPLLGSGGFCELDVAVRKLIDLGYADVVVGAALAEHQRLRRIDVSTYNHAPTLIHATASLIPWLEQQPRRKLRRESQRAKGRQRDPKLEARDKWIYRECCKLTPYKVIKSKLKELCKSKGWEEIGTEQGVLQAAQRYAKGHELESPPSRRQVNG